MKRIFFLAPLGLLAILAGWHFYGLSSAVQKADLDPRNYRTLTLKNQIEVLLIQDPATTKAAAALSVGVGQFQDPADYPGLAHYLEHMLFMGTQAYPDPAEFGDFLARHGGFSNAYTAFEETNYHFALQAEQFAGALERFSEFFVHPLLNGTYAAQELQAVDSEHQKNLNNDYRRTYQVLAETANPEHPLHNFGTGSLKSIGGGHDAAALGAKLKEFYESHYSANRMKLVLLAPLDLDQQALLAEKYFSRIPNKNLAPAAYSQIPLVAAPLPRQIQVLPIQNLRSLQFVFEVDSQWPYRQTRPLEVVGHLLGHEAQHSLLSLLKEKGWVTELQAGGMPPLRGTGIFTLSLTLTPEGLTRVDEITQLLFAYLELMKRQPDLSGYYAELRAMAELEFQTAEPDEPFDDVTRLASRMQQVPGAEAPAAERLSAGYPGEEVKALLAQLTPARMTRVLLAPGVETDQVEPHYQAPYKTFALNPASFQPATGLGLQLPNLNPFLPDDFKIKPIASPQAEPVRIAQGTNFEHWHKQGDGHDSAKAFFQVRLQTPVAYESAQAAALTKIWTDLLQDRLTEVAYQAQLAGLNYHLTNGVTGLELSLSGLPQKMPLLLAEVLTELRRQDFAAEKFAIHHRALMEDRQNRSQTKAYQRAVYEHNYLMSTPLWHDRDYLSVAAGLSVADLQAFAPRLLGALKLQLLTTGNLTQDEASSLRQTLLAGLPPQAPQPGAVPLERAMLLNPGETLTHSFKVNDANSAIYLYYQAGPRDLLQETGLDLLNLMLEKPFYHQLRTTEQLGYMVWCGNADLHGVQGFVFLIQSSGQGPSFLKARIQAFVGQWVKALAALPPAEFQEYKTALTNQYAEPPENLREETARYWRFLEQQRAFNHLAKKSEVLQGVTQAQFVTLAERLFLSKEARVLSSEAWGNGNQPSLPPLVAESLRARHEFVNRETP